MHDDSSVASYYRLIDQSLACMVIMQSVTCRLCLHTRMHVHCLLYMNLKQIVFVQQYIIIMHNSVAIYIIFLV